VYNLCNTSKAYLRKQNKPKIWWMSINQDHGRRSTPYTPWSIPPYQKSNGLNLNSVVAIRHTKSHNFKLNICCCDHHLDQILNRVLVMMMVKLIIDLVMCAINLGFFFLPKDWPHHDFFLNDPKGNRGHLLCNDNIEFDQPQHTNQGPY